MTREHFLPGGVDDCKHEGVAGTLEDSDGKIYASGYSFFHEIGGNYNVLGNSDKVLTQ